MGKKVRSAKGEMVDFDFLKIKEQLASAPTPMEVKNRQNFIENRLKRRLKKKLPVIEKTAVEVDVKLPEPEPESEVTATAITSDDDIVVKVVLDDLVEEAPVTKQKARKKKNT